MKKPLLSISVLALLFAHALFAQDFRGDWQGTLKAGPQEIRIVFKISQDDGKLKAVAYAITPQGSQAIPANAITSSGSSLKMTIAAIGGSYEGKLGADGKSIAGTMTTPAGPQPFDLAKATPETAWAIPDPVPQMKMMAEDAKPQFEVTTVKPSKTEERFSLLVNPQNGMLTTTATSLNDLIKFAYDLHPKQILNGPAWIESEKFDVTGKPDTPGVPHGNQLKALLQQLIADRFALKFHREPRELSAYALSLAKGGIKAAEDTRNPNGLPGFGGNPLRGFMVQNSTMAELAGILQGNLLDQPVVDQTGLGKTRYDFLLKFTPDASMMPPGAAPPPNAAPGVGTDDAPPDIFSAFEQQVGLQLKKTRTQVETLVIDHVEKPSAN